MEKRKIMGKAEIVAGGTVLFPAPDSLQNMPGDYAPFIQSIIDDIEQQKIQTFLRANNDMICLYWRIGRRVLEKQEKEGWGTKVIDRMAHDLKTAFPEMSGFSTRNIKYMRKFAEIYDLEFVQRVVAQIPWRTNAGAG